jgi:hypothetical protein
MRDKAGQRIAAQDAIVLAVSLRRLPVGIRGWRLIVESACNRFFARPCPGGTIPAIFGRVLIRAPVSWQGVFRPLSFHQRNHRELHFRERQGVVTQAQNHAIGLLRSSGAVTIVDNGGVKRVYLPPEGIFDGHCRP